MRAEEEDSQIEREEGEGVSELRTNCGGKKPHAGTHVPHVISRWRICAVTRVTRFVNLGRHSINGFCVCTSIEFFSGRANVHVRLSHTYTTHANAHTSPGGRPTGKEVHKRPPHAPPTRGKLPPKSTFFFQSFLV